MFKEYKNQTIVFNEKTEEWECGALKDKSLKNVCAQIDHNFKAGFVRQNAYLSKYGNSVVLAVVTSIAPDGLTAQCSVTRTDGEVYRGKYDTHYLHPINPDTEKIVSEIETLNIVIADCDKDRGKLMASLPKLRFK